MRRMHLLRCVFEVLHYVFALFLVAHVMLQRLRAVVSRALLVSV